MFSMSASQLELFRLRFLLSNVKGAKCYNHLKTVKGVQYSTYFEACIALGLIENDKEWDRAMQEAVSWMMPCSLRRLFVRILIHCEPMYPEKLWKNLRMLYLKIFAILN